MSSAWPGVRVRRFQRVSGVFAEKINTGWEAQFPTQSFMESQATPITITVTGNSGNTLLTLCADML